MKHMILQTQTKLLKYGWFMISDAKFSKLLYVLSTAASAGNRLKTKNLTQFRWWIRGHFNNYEG